jgi:hypothetical protein
VHAAAELFLSTGEAIFADAVLRETELIAAVPERLGWVAARVVHSLNNDAFTAALYVPDNG